MGAPLFQRAIRHEGQPVAMVGRWQHEAAVIEVAASDTVRLAITLDGGQHVHGEAGGKLAADDIGVGSISLFPATEDSRIEVVGCADILQIFIHAEYLKRVLGSEFTCSTLFDLHDPSFQAGAMQVLIGAAGEQRADMRLLEAGLERLVRRLGNFFDEQSSRNSAARFTRGGLSPSAFRRVEAAIASAIRGSVVRSPALAELAAAADLSVSHFQRAFRQQTGETPHRHIVRRRLELAIALLRDSAISVAEVADETGFATPAHFVATFRRVLGVTPGALHQVLAS